MTSGLTGNTECIILVLLEMGLSFFGIVSNLLIVTTLRNEETLRASTLNFLLFNLCFSNLVISFLVKPISAIYIGYAVSTGEAQVSFSRKKQVPLQFLALDWSYPFNFLTRPMFRSIYKTITNCTPCDNDMR